jgi:hypothetical protein
MANVGFENVISVETDALYTTVPMPADTLPHMHNSVPFRIGKQLKCWEAEEWTGLILLQSGIYWKRAQSGWKKGQTRGLAKVGSKGVTAQDALAFLERLQSEPSSTLDTQITTFHGIGRMKYPDWLTWSQDMKSIKFGGSGKRIYWPAMTTGSPARSLVPFYNGSVAFRDLWAPQSAPHPLVWSEYGYTENKQQFDIAAREDGEQWEN